MMLPATDKATTMMPVASFRRRSAPKRSETLRNAPKRSETRRNTPKRAETRRTVPNHAETRRTARQKALKRAEMLRNYRLPSVVSILPSPLPAEGVATRLGPGHSDSQQRGRRSRRTCPVPDFAVRFKFRTSPQALFEASWKSQ